MQSSRAAITVAQQAEMNPAWKSSLKKMENPVDEEKSVTALRETRTKPEATRRGELTDAWWVGKIRHNAGCPVKARGASALCCGD